MQDEYYITYLEKQNKKRVNISLKQVCDAQKRISVFEKEYKKSNVNLGQVDSYNEDVALVKNFWRTKKRINYTFSA